MDIFLQVDVWARALREVADCWGEKKRKETGYKRKKRSDKLVECVANSLLDLKPHVAHRHIFPE